MSVKLSSNIAQISNHTHLQTCMHAQKHTQKNYAHIQIHNTNKKS